MQFFNSSKSDDSLIHHDYGYIHHQVDSNSKVGDAALNPPSGLSPTNFIEIHRDVDSPISARFLIDMGIDDPDISLRQTPQADTVYELRTTGQYCEEQLLFTHLLYSHISGRKNLIVESKHGSINAEIWITNSSGKQRNTNLFNRDGTDLLKPNECRNYDELTSVEIKSFHDPLDVKIHSDCFSNPFYLKASSRHDNVSVYLPFSFTGPIILYKEQGRVRVSKDVQARMTELLDTKNTQVCFLGDLSLLNHGQPWEGSVVDISIQYGKIVLAYVEETEDRVVNSLWNRILRAFSQHRIRIV